MTEAKYFAGEDAWMLPSYALISRVDIGVAFTERFGFLVELWTNPWNGGGPMHVAEGLRIGLESPIGKGLPEVLDIRSRPIAENGKL